MYNPKDPQVGEWYTIQNDRRYVRYVDDDVVVTTSWAPGIRPFPGYARTYLRDRFAERAVPDLPGLVEERRFLEERKGVLSGKTYLSEVGHGGLDFCQPTGRRLELRRDGTWKEYYVDPNDPDPPHPEDDECPT